MMRECGWVVILIGAICLPTAQAGGPIEATVDGGRGPCGPGGLVAVDGVSGCFFSQDERGTDIQQRNLSARVAVREDFWSDHGLTPPLADPVRVDGSSVVVPNPAFRTAEWALANRTATHPLASWAGANLTPEQYDYWYYGPSVGNPWNGSDTRYGHSSFGDDWVGHDNLGPFDDVGESTSEQVLDQYQAFTCTMAGTRACKEHADAIRSAGAAWTPRVAFGIELGQVDFEPAAEPTWMARDATSHDGALPGRISTPSASDPLSLQPGGQTPKSSLAQAFVPDAKLSGGPNIGPAPVRKDTRVDPQIPRTADRLPQIVATATAGLLLVLAALYARIHRREEALRSRRRLEIVEVLKVQGPTSIASLARALKVDRTTVEHHARVLERTGEARSRREGRLIYVFLPGQPVDELAGAPRPTEALLLQTLDDSGGVLDRRDLVDRIPHVAARTRNHALSQLVKRGAVRLEFDGLAQRIIRAKLKDGPAEARG